MTWGTVDSIFVLSVADVATVKRNTWTTGIAKMTKAEEMVLFSNLVKNLPEGYVRDILTEAEPMIAREIQNDMATAEPITGLMSARTELAKALEEMRQMITKEAAELQKIRREKESIERQFDAVKSDIRVLAMSIK